MKLAFLNSCLRELDLEDTFKWAKENGFQCLELTGAPWYKYVDIEELARGNVNWLISLEERYGINIVAIMYGGRNLDPDLNIREESLNRLKAIIRSAKNLNIPVVSTFIGRDYTKPVEENLKLVKEVWPPIIEFAERYNIKIAIENCPMMGVWPSGLNIAFSPEIWKEIFDILPSKILGLNFDPSHLVWQGIDYIKAIKDFGDRIYHVHAKDTEILKDKLSSAGIYGENWWRYRIPGRGLVDWGKLIDTLLQVGYDGVISIEHEDPVWEGTEEKVKRGLLLGKRHLEQFLD
ncbi:MAG: sugar phosphate isomerase/epimerase family protein [bacterium]